MKDETRVDLYVVAKILLLLGFSVFFFVIVVTGRVNLYVHPRVRPFLVMASVVMALTALLMLPQVISRHVHRRPMWPLLFFAVPLLLAIAIPPQAMGSDSVNTQDLLSIGQSGASTGDAAQQKATEVPAAEATPEARATASASDDRLNTDAPTDAADDTIIVTSENFYETLSLIYADTDSYLGRRIDLVGFVFFDPIYFTDTQFVPARMLMTCCTADMVAVGLLCEYDKASSLKEDSWVEVVGTIGQTESMGETVPCILAESVTKTDVPDVEYIYPY